MSTAITQGQVWDPADLEAGLEEAFSYRGDITLTLKDGRTVEGYLFDRRPGVVRLMPKDGTGKVAVAQAEIAGLAFSGRDTAAGKSWEAWVKKYFEKKAAGETGIGLEPEMLD